MRKGQNLLKAAGEGVAAVFARRTVHSGLWQRTLMARLVPASARRNAGSGIL